MDAATLKRYEQMIEGWQRIQSDVDNNLKALVIILDKFLLFSGADAEDKDDMSGVLVNRLINSYSKDCQGLESKAVAVAVAMDEAMDLLAEIKDSPQKKITDASPLIANIVSNVPGAVSFFLQRQSDKMLQIVCEIRAACQSFKESTRPRMQQVYDSVIVRMNRKILSIEDGDDDYVPISLDLVYNSFDVIAKEIEALLQLVDTLDIYPTQKPQIQAYIQQIRGFKMVNLAAYRTKLD